MGRHVACTADGRNACMISTGKLLKSGSLKEEKEVEDNFGINLRRTVCYV